MKAILGKDDIAEYNATGTGHNEYIKTLMTPILRGLKPRLAAYRRMKGESFSP
jgi:hypothetical protein